MYVLLHQDSLSNITTGYIAATNTSKFIELGSILQSRLDFCNRPLPLAKEICETPIGFLCIQLRKVQEQISTFDDSSDEDRKSTHQAFEDYGCPQDRDMDLARVLDTGS